MSGALALTGLSASERIWKSSLAMPFCMCLGRSSKRGVPRFGRIIQLIYNNIHCHQEIGTTHKVGRLQLSQEKPIRSGFPCFSPHQSLLIIKTRGQPFDDSRAMGKYLYTCRVYTENKINKQSYPPRVSQSCSGAYHFRGKVKHCTEALHSWDANSLHTSE